jgi:hypothetical protein
MLGNGGGEEMKQKDRDAFIKSLRDLTEKVKSGEIEIQSITSRRGVMTEYSDDGYKMHFPTGEMWLEIHCFKMR